MQRLADERPRVVVLGHGDVGGPQLLADTRDYLQLLRDETWVRRDSAVSEVTIAAEVSALMIARHPKWPGRSGSRRASAACTPSDATTPGEHAGGLTPARRRRSRVARGRG